MAKFDLAKSVMSVKAPPLDRKETRLLTEDVENRPWNKEVRQSFPNVVSQATEQKVAQVGVQSVAQVPWVAQAVAQDRPKKVAQREPQSVAQSRLQSVAQERLQSITQSEINNNKELVKKNVEVLKEQISQILDVDGRKRFVREIGWGISTEKRGKKYYLFGIKKLCGDKYKLYIGNATS